MAAFDAHRRRLLTAIVAAPLLSAGWARAASRTVTLAAAWDDAAGRHAVGLIEVNAQRIRVLDQIEVPTRAHGLACTRDGCMLAVARRPGDWLLRWRPGDRPRWLWAEDEHRFNGHLLLAPDERALYTTEFGLGDGQGLLVQRDPLTLAAHSEWPTHGRDPHGLEWLPDATVLVANGGIETLPETGRKKHNLAAMDSSLVRIDSRDGRLAGRFLLGDRRLSIRHVAWHASGGIGVALQAEHDTEGAREAAPVFATLDLASGTLRARADVRTPSGYTGDIAALPEGWLVSCPKDSAVLRVPLDGGPILAHALAEVCAIAPGHAQAWALGNAAALAVSAAGLDHLGAPALRFDNHAQAWHRAWPRSPRDDDHARGA